MNFIEKSEKIDANVKHEMQMKLKDEFESKL